MRIFGLDILRATAILSVLICHIAVSLAAADPSIQANASLLYTFVLPTGFLGVEIFFVLSGFLIGQIIVKLYRSGIDWPKIREFYTRRWFRTLPLYYLLLGMKAIVQPQGFPLSALVFLHWLRPKDLEYFGITWSLCVEEWFYLLLPLICWGVYRLFKGKRLGYALLGLIFIMIILRTWYVGGHAAYLGFEENVRKCPPLRFDALLLGVLVALLKQNWRDTFTTMAKPWFAAFFGLLMLVLYSVWSLQSNGWGVVGQTAFMPFLSISVAGIIPWMDQSIWVNRQLASWRWFSWPVTQISLISYSLYLTHVVFMPKIHVWTGQPWLTGLSVLAILAVVFITANLFFYGVEKPALKLRDILSPA